MNEPNWSPPDSLKAIRSKAWIVGSLGVAASAIGFLAQRQQFFQSYLVAWVFWISITLGCLAIMMLQHLTGGGWGLMVRRTLEAATRTLPLLTILFLPILLGLEDIYVWARPEAANDPLIQHKASYLNPTAFAIRSLVYLGIWTFFAWALSRLSLKQDQTGDPGLFRRMQVYSAPGLVVFSLLATFASIDWLMSLDPHWYSSIFGVYFIIGTGVAGFAFVSIVRLYLSQRQPLAGTIQPKHFHDYGKLLLAFVMLWAYMGVSQLLIIWSGNLPEEVPWYLHRVQGGWKWVSIPSCYCTSCCPSSCCSPRLQAQRPFSSGGFTDGLADAVGRHLLARRADVSSPPGRALARHRHHGRYRWHLGSGLRRAAREADRCCPSTTPTSRRLWPMTSGKQQLDGEINIRFSGV